MIKDKRFKILLISLVVSLPFWWGMNALADMLEDFFFWQEIVENPQILAADIVHIIKPKPPEILIDNLEDNTKAALSIDNRGEILFEKNFQDILPIASLTKLMTALVVFDLDETYDFTQLIKISNEAVEQEGTSRYGELKQGDIFSLETLIHIMLIESSNDAAYAIGEVIGQEGFVELMNIYAKDIGLDNTHFINLSGLESDDLQMNLSTSQDLVKLSRYILKEYPEIFEITTNISYEVLNSDNSLHYFIPQNTNELLREYPEIIGGKTGWSPKAGGCLLLVLKNPPKDSYNINIVLGANDRFEEMRKLIQLTKENP
jgi:D-alanyl-D-alanine carboxypeptidase